MANSGSRESDFGSFYRASLSPLRRYLSALLRNEHDAQDIAHDAFLKTFDAVNRQSARNAEAVLFATARNLALNFRTRRIARLQPVPDETLDDIGATAENPADITAGNDAADALEQAVLNLPERCRQTLALRYLEGLSHDEICVRLGISHSAVEKNLARGLQLMRRQKRTFSR